MERYSKESTSKWQLRYSEDFKRFICEEYIKGSSSKQQIELKHNIGKSRLTYWLREMENSTKNLGIISLSEMKEQLNPTTNKDDNKSLTQLKIELEESRLLAEAYRKMVEIAEREFKITIIKKSNTK